MKNFSFNFKFLAVAVFLFCCISLLTCTKQADWIVLFDGTSTDAWRGYLRNDFPTGGWAVTDGTLKTIVGGDKVFIITKETFDNFELTLEWKVAPGGNSGIFYRVVEDSNLSDWQYGPEMQVLDDNLHPDGKNPKTSAGALYDLIAPTNKTLQPVGEFNKIRIIAQGNHIEHWINGEKVLEYEVGSNSFKNLIPGSKFKNYPKFIEAKKGHIALQHHGEEVWYRNIKIRHLK